MNIPNSKDPIEHIEKVVKNIHDSAEGHVQPVLKRYPISFALLVTFSLAAILHGFELVTDKIEFLHNNPWILIISGVAVLILTGMAYKVLDAKRGH